MNEIIHRNTGTDRHISQQVKKSALLSLWGLPYKQEELCCPAQHQTPRVKLSEAVPWAFVDLTVLTWLVTSVESDSCNPTDCSPPGSSVHGILQARILEWATMPSSRGSSQLRDQTQVSCIADSLPAELPGKPYATLHSVQSEREPV